ncbi:MAG: tetratricopeptide repeat protein [Candidatus Cloacimonetes bacterium]|nr:tetratricopeptide repeat protein [Candidatus Cloacimonadota bacterium]
MKKIILIICIIFVSFVLDAGVQEEFDFAKKMYDDTLYEEAIGKFQDIIQKYSNSTLAEEAQFYLGNSYMELEQYVNASFAYKRLLEDHPNTTLYPQTVYKLAESLFQSRNYFEAAQFYQDLIYNYPQSPYALQSLDKIIVSLKNAGMYNEAILISMDIIESFSGKAQISSILLSLASVYELHNMPDEYEQTLLTIINQYPQSDEKWKAIQELSQYYYENKMQDKALQLLKDGLTESIPRMYQQSLLLLYAELLYKNGDRQEALEQNKEFYRKFDTYPQRDEIADKIASLEFALNRYGNTIVTCKEFQNNFPKSSYLSHIQYIQAYAEYNLKNYDQALEILDIIDFEATRITIQKDIYQLRAKIYLKKNDYPFAISTYLDIIKRYPHITSVDSIYYEIGQLYQNYLKDYEAAINYYFVIVTTFPESDLRGKTYLELACCSTERNNYDEAADYYKKALATHSLPENERDRATKMLAYIENYKQKNEGQALDNLVQTFAQFVRSNDYIATITSLIEIYTNDLKEFDKALELIESDPLFVSDPGLILLKGEIYLKLADKASLGEDDDADKYKAQAQQLFGSIVDNYHDIPEKAYAEYYLIPLKVRFLDPMSDDYLNSLQQLSLYFIEIYPTFPKIGTVYFNLGKALIQNDKKDEQTITYLQKAASLTGDANIRNEAYQYLGDLYLENEGYIAARNQYQKIDEKTLSADPQLLFNVGFVYYQLKSYSQSVLYLDYYVQNYPEQEKYLDVLNLLASTYITLNETEKAIAIYATLAEKAPTDALLRTLRNLYINQDKFEKALDVSMKIEDLSKKDRYILAEIYEAQGNISYAILQYSRIISLNVAEDTMLVDTEHLAELYMSIEDISSALANYTKIFNLTESYKDPFQSFSYLDWARIAENTIVAYYRSKNRTQAEAFEKYYKSIIKDNDEVQAHITLERGIYYSQLDQKKAQKLFEEVIDDYSSTEYTDDAYLELAIMALGNEKFDEADTYLTTLLQNFPDSPLKYNVYLKLGSMNFSEGNFKDALDYYQKVIQQDTEGTYAMQAIENFALTCKAMGEWMLAIEAYQMLIDRFGSPEMTPQTIFEISYCYYMDKEYRKAIQLFKTIQDQFTDSEIKAEIIYWIGESYYGMKEYDQAIETLLKIVYDYNFLDQWYVNANIKIAMAYEKLQKFDKARLFYKNVIERYGTNSNWGAEAKKLLDALP